MGKLITKFKKSLIWITAVAMTSTTISPAAAFATEIKPEVQVENHTVSSEETKTVSGITISGVDAPREGTLLDEKAVVTTAEEDTWEIPVIWIGEDLKPDTGLAGKGTYIPVLSYFVPEVYTVQNDNGSGTGYTIRLSEDLMKLFGDEEDLKIISIYDAKTGITYILPAKLKDLFTDKSKAELPHDKSSTLIIPSEYGVSGDDGSETTEEASGAYGGDPEQEQKEQENQEESKQEESQNSDFVTLHCDEAARNAFSHDDLEFLAKLVIYTLEPQAINLLAKSFPAFEKGIADGEIGKYIGISVTYENSSTFGYATNGWTNDNRFVYKFVINAGGVSKTDQDGKLKVIRDTNSTELADLANTVCHELFHVYMYDYNRPGMTGKLYINGALGEESDKVNLPIWFKEGTASSVENNWQERRGVINLLRTPDDSNTFLSYFDKNLLLQRYVNGRSTKGENGETVKEYNFDIQYCNGVDINGDKVETTSSRYISGYFANLYLSELAARSLSGGSARIVEDGYLHYDSSKLRAGMNSILERMHKGETLDHIINDISGGTYTDTNDFEAKFVKGPMSEDRTFYGDADSLNFLYEITNYFAAIDNVQSMKNYANGSLLFDFNKDYRSPLDLTAEEIAKAMAFEFVEECDYKQYVFSTVAESTASSTGGKSESGTQVSTNSKMSNVVDFPAASSDTSSRTQAAAKTVSADGITENAEAAVTAATEETASAVSESADAAATEETAADADDTASDNTASEASVADKADNSGAEETVPAAETSDSASDSAAGSTATGNSAADGSAADSSAAGTAASTEATAPVDAAPAETVETVEKEEPAEVEDASAEEAASTEE